MALDDALLEARSCDSIGDCIRFFQFYPSAVTIGRFQGLHREVNIGACAVRGIDIVRRPTGGGTVFHDTGGELTYSVVMGQTKDTQTIGDAFAHICSGVVMGLHELGVEAVFAPVNDITVSGKKISGSAQARRKSALLQHGTIMYATDLSLLQELLSVSRAKLRGKGIPSVDKRVTTLQRESSACCIGDVMSAMEKGFSQLFGPMGGCNIPAHVSTLACRLHDRRYSTQQHTETLP